jgi:hypothetical protein
LGFVTPHHCPITASISSIDLELSQPVKYDIQEMKHENAKYFYIVSYDIPCDFCHVVWIDSEPSKNVGVDFVFYLYSVSLELVE